MYLLLDLKLFVTFCNNFCCTSLFKDTSPLNYVICLVPVHKQLIHRLPGFNTYVTGMGRHKIYGWFQALRV